MKYPVTIESINSSTEFYSEVNVLVNEAKRYLKEHPWCKEIHSGWLFTNIVYAICIFLLKLKTRKVQKIINMGCCR